jgi:hypothetical protein
VVTGTYGTVGGGYLNTASGHSGAICGGNQNVVTSTYGTVGGGHRNVVTATGATIGGGDLNTAGGAYSTIAGGGQNTTLAQDAAIGGGSFNTASGMYSCIPGGRSNTAAGLYSFAAGRRARALHNGAFVWGDSTNAYIDSPGANTFIVRASGGITMYSDSAATTGVRLAPGGTSFDPTSDRALKENFAPVDAVEILEQVASLPVETWNLRSQGPSVRHIGPVAQDFYATFGFGEDNRHINMQDANGVALAAIQGLYELSLEQAERIEVLEGENVALRQRLDEVDARLAALEATARAAAGSPLPGAAKEPGALGWLGCVLAVAIAGVTVYRRRSESTCEGSNE